MNKKFVYQVGNNKKVTQISVSWKSVQWEQICSVRTDGRVDEHTDPHDEANSRFSQFWESA